MKFVLLVEGATEKNAAAEFLKRWLDPQLDQAVGIQVIPFKGYAQLARKVVKKAQMFLDGPKHGEIIAVLGLLDLYGPGFYPDHVTEADERFEWGVDHFQKQVARDRFRMFFAVHEFEAWLLSQPEIFPREVKTSLPGKVARPETVNFDEPPAKLLDKIYKQTVKRDYKKTTYGQQLFRKLDPDVAAEKYPYLKEMLGEMLKMAKAAGL
ncbi:MAG: DUF4276 family protein [Planctomycetota bacterium]|nr:DUF4276 family protein [Planctomycetota bacterium]